MNKINIKVWVSTKSGMPLNNNPVLCRLKLDEQNITKDAVLFVNDDGEWRTEDDCEISYSWNVVSWQSEVEVETNIENIGDVENFLAHKEKEIELKNTEIEILQHKITKLKFAGSGLANCCYNLSQQAGIVLSRRDAESMKKSYERWDLISKK